MRIRATNRPFMAIACAVSVLLAVSALAGGPTREPPLPTAGAPDYIHFGPRGLCVEHTDWNHVDEGEIRADHDRRLISIKGSYDYETFVTVFWFGGGGPPFDDPWGASLVIQRTIYIDEDTVDYDEVWLPYYDPGAGGIGGLTTAGTPKELYWKKIEYRGSTSIPNAFRNSTAIPTYARAWFAPLTMDDERGFLGGDAPDCVRGSSNDDEISGRGGADRLVGQYGDDFLSGGAGPDTLEGGADDDELYGGRDADHLLGQGDDDCLSGGIDGVPDLLEDSHNTVDQNLYIAEDIDVIFEEAPLIVNDCF